MIAIEVTFLTGRYVASAHDRRDAHEWPPHWARMYSAMVAAWGDDGQDAEEAALLRDIEAWAHPAITASEASARGVPAHWVPVNDTSVHGLALQQRQTKKLDDGLQRLSALDGSGSPKQLAAAQKRVDAARDVAQQVARIGKTPPELALQLLPEHRVRQERRYPSVTPVDPTVMFVWADPVLEPEVVDRLDDLLSRVVRLGHSSSLVTCRAVTTLPPGAPAPRFVPDRQVREGRVTLRSVGAGQLDALVAGYRRHQGSGPRSMPHRAATYRDRTRQPDGVPPPERSALSGDMIVFERTSGARLPLTRSVEVARALRGALMAHGADPLPEVISGHRARTGTEGETEPSASPHVAYLALPFVDHVHATGHLLGAAIVLPRDISADDRAKVEAAIAAARLASASPSNAAMRGPRQPLQITLGRSGVIDLTAVLDERPSSALRISTWCRRARTWTSVTPIALPRHPGSLTGASSARLRRAWERAEDAIVDSCRHVGLPDPVGIELQLAPFVAGSRDVRRFPAFKQGDSADQRVRALVHAEVTFERPIAGPVLLGAGRYQGLGLMRPVVAR